MANDLTKIDVQIEFNLIRFTFNSKWHKVVVALIRKRAINKISSVFIEWNLEEKEEEEEKREKAMDQNRISKQMFSDCDALQKISEICHRY